MFQDLTSLIVDIGTNKTRVGYGGDDAPKIIASSYVCSSSQI
jgi:actin-related protein